MRCASALSCWPPVPKPRGERHPDTLAIAVLVASWRLGGGDVSGALDAARELVPKATEVLGADHPSTVSARHVLVSCDLMEAVVEAKRSVGQAVREFGAASQECLSRRYELAETLWRGA